MPTMWQLQPCAAISCAIVVSDRGSPYGAPAAMKPWERPSRYGNLPVMMAPLDGLHTSCVYIASSLTPALASASRCGVRASVPGRYPMSANPKSYIHMRMHRTGGGEAGGAERRQRTQLRAAHICQQKHDVRRRWLQTICRPQ